MALPIIKNYGFLWERKFLYRGKGGTSGHLKGYKQRGSANGKSHADFREQIGVYVLYDRNQNIVYLGQAGNGNAKLFDRLKNHEDGRIQNRWEYFTWIGFRDVNADGGLSFQQRVDSVVSGFKYSDALDEIEGILIEVIEPKLNKQSGKLKGATEYFQVQDEHVIEVSMEKLHKKIVEVKEKLDKLPNEH